MWKTELNSLQTLVFKPFDENKKKKTSTTLHERFFNQTFLERLIDEFMNITDKFFIFNLKNFHKHSKRKIW